MVDAVDTTPRRVICTLYEGQGTEVFCPRITGGRLPGVSVKSFYSVVKEQIQHATWVARCNNITISKRSQGQGRQNLGPNSKKQPGRRVNHPLVFEIRPYFDSELCSPVLGDFVLICLPYSNIRHFPVQNRWCFAPIKLEIANAMTIVINIFALPLVHCYISGDAE